MRGANEIKTARARRLRLDSTDAERRLWYRLRSRQIDGAKFVRQGPIGPYVVDFVCRDKRIVIEVDGGQHADSDRDRIRDQWLREHNYQVLRFWNNDVLSNTNSVLEVIASALQAERPPHPLAFGERPRIKSGAGSLPASGER